MTIFGQRIRSMWKHKFWRAVYICMGISINMVQWGKHRRDRINPFNIYEANLEASRHSRQSVVVWGQTGQRVPHIYVYVYVDMMMEDIHWFVGRCWCSPCDDARSLGLAFDSVIFQQTLNWAFFCRRCHYLKIVIYLSNEAIRCVVISIRTIYVKGIISLRVWSFMLSE